MRPRYSATVARDDGSKHHQAKAIFRYACVFMLGVWYGRVHSAPQESSNSATSVVRTMNANPTNTSTTENQNGWKPVHVFYGHVLPAPTEAKVYSQARQDEMILALLASSDSTTGGGATGGRYFLDLAANHAYRLSNTYRLEQQTAPRWKGLCMEANPGYWYDLTRYRTCDIVGAVIGGNSTATPAETLQFEFVNVAGHGGMSDQGTSGGIVHADFDHKKPGSNTRNVYPVPIAHILQKFQVPKIIDYMSLDVEGAEYYIMLNFPFHAYEIKIMTIERPTEPLRDLLTAHNYELVGDLTVWGETLWVHSKHKANLAMQALKDGRQGGKPIKTLA